MDSEDGGHKRKQKGKKGKKGEPEQTQVQQTEEQSNQQSNETINPLNVVYCQVCSLPPEYCMIGKKAVECKAWLEKNHPDLFEEIYSQEQQQEEKNEPQENPVESEESKQQDQQQTEKKEEEKPKKKKVVKVKENNTILITTHQRMKNKYITTITGLDKFDLDLKEVVKKLSKKFASGCNVEDNAIKIQGDLSYDLLEYLPQQYKNISEDQIDIKEK